ncbi:MAG: hypothetical protein Q7U75_18750, partial [Desulfobacterales bacterium]|nr:hypothetical protein [Desulfobacterales bacterium]
MPEKLWKGRFMSHRRAAILVTVLLAGMLFGCGRKLPPSPPPQYMPPVVADLSFKLEENRVTLSWTVPQLQDKDQPAPAGFRIFRARQMSSEAVCSTCKLDFRQTGDVTSKGKKPGSPLHFSETLLPGYKYVYKVVAYDAKGFDGKDSKSIEVV